MEERERLVKLKGISASELKHEFENLVSLLKSEIITSETNIRMHLHKRGE